MQGTSERAILGRRDRAAAGRMIGAVGLVALAGVVALGAGCATSRTAAVPPGAAGSPAPGPPAAGGGTVPAPPAPVPPVAAVPPADTPPPPVVPPPSGVDRELAARVARTLAADPALRDATIAAEVQDGRVMLTGTVPTFRERTIAIERALGVPGVKSVRARLVLQAQ